MLAINFFVLTPKNDALVVLQDTISKQEKEIEHLTEKTLKYQESKIRVLTPTLEKLNNLSPQ
jgi:uncharacterized coiled-coil protein SlyX